MSENFLPELLKTFPEAKSIIPAKIAELEGKKKELEKIIELKNYISTLFSDDFEKQYWPLVVDAIEGKKLKEIKNNLFRLYRQKNLSEGRKGKKEPLNIEEARRFPIADLMTTTARRQGTRLVYSCPLGHADKTPSFYLYPENKFHCFSCGAGGDSIDFLRIRDGYDFVGAVKILSRGQA